MVRVFYPSPDVSMVLRTDADWNRNVEPEATENGTVFRFTLASQRPFVYFKPCIIDGDHVHWSPGMNSLAVLSEPGPRDSSGNSGEGARVGLSGQQRRAQLL